MRQQDKAVHPQGETLAENERVYRIEVVETFLKAGLPLSKIAFFRPLLEQTATRLPERTVLSRVIPTVLTMEKDGLRKKLDGRDIAAIFDGTTRLGEALVIVFR